jgi:hypothetical protein
MSSETKPPNHMQKTQSKKNWEAEDALQEIKNARYSRVHKGIRKSWNKELAKIARKEHQETNSLKKTATPKIVVLTAEQKAAKDAEARSKVQRLAKAPSYNVLTGLWE